MRTLFAICLILSSGSILVAGPAELEIASQVDAKLTELFAAENVTPAGLASDEDFLRRVSLDLAGVVPSPGEVTLFGLNPDPNKRSKKIDELLASEAYGKIWGSYWKDVVFIAATEQRTRLVEPGFEAWLVDEFNANRPWDEITRELITATGRVDEEGRTGLIFAHTGQPEELAAEISRIFMGIQMSCANCHDHPTDSWKREQFHGLAAFLPRVSVRREDPGMPNSFAVRSAEFNGRRGRGDLDPEQLFQFMDRNRDGKLNKSEAQGPLKDRFDQILTVADQDKDKQISKDEFAVIRAMMDNQQPGRGEEEYHMPDLNNPASKGELMQPVFFVEEAKGPKLKEGADDMTRRHALVDYITAKSNPWFAMAFVNRVWSEMLGQGFYMPIDDMGPERTAMFEEVLGILAEGFRDNDYNVKWLYRTIANTEAYQRTMQTESSDSITPFAAASPMRMRSDQIYNAYKQVLGIEDSFSNRGAYGMQNNMLRGRRGDAGRIAFATLFSYDPSMPQEDIIGNIPQALFMMNSPQLEGLVNGNADTKLGRILNKYEDDTDAISELYLLVLARSPSNKEVEIAQQYIKQVNNRSEAFEDLMWSLLNSTEFLSKR